MKHPLKNPARLRSVIKSAGLSLMAAAIVGTNGQAQAQTYSLSNTWALPGTIQNLDTSANNRGMCYASSSNGTPVNLVLVNNKGTHAIYAYDGATGNLVTGVNSNNLSGGNFTLNKLAVTSAGQLLGANLTTSIGAGGFKIYNWGDWSQGANVSYSAAGGDALVANLSGKRIGDSFAYTGSGTSTLLLYSVAVTSSNYFAMFSTTDGTTFTPTVLVVPTGLPAPGSGVQIGYCFYTNNTFFIVPDGPSGVAGGKVYLVQYPPNFASLPSPVTATVIATNTFPAINWVDFSYKPSAGLLAVHANASAPVSLYTLPTTNFSALGLLATTNLSFSTSTSINGNESGDIALANTNYIYTLDTSAGLQATSIGFVAAPLPPSISTAPTGGTVYTNLGSFTFTVSAGGTPPLYYQWQYSPATNVAATNIPLATNSTYTVSPLTIGASGYYDVVVSNVAGFTNSTPVKLTVIAPLANASVTQLWALPADNSEPYLDTGYNTRGLAFDPSSMSVVVAEHSAAQIYALNATNGALKFPVTAASTGLPAGSIFPLGQVGVADDGVLYSCNVSSYQPGQQTGGVDFFIARFQYVGPGTNSDGSSPNVTNVPYASFMGDPGSALVYPGATYSGGDRWGDSFAVRGAGTNTQILLGTYETIGGNQFGTGPGTNVAILTTADGSNFVATTIVCFEPDNSTNTPPDGFSYLGVAWGAGNTFWTKSPGYDLRQFSFNLTNGTATNLLNFATTAGAGSLSGLDGIGLDVSNNILGGVLTSDTPNDLELFQIPTLGFPPEAYYQDFFPTYNANINGNAATTLKFPYIFSLDANNGIIGLQYSIPLLPFNIAYTNIGSKLILTYQTTIGHTFQLQSTASLAIPPQTNTWLNVGSAFVAPASGTQSYTNSSLTGSSLFYRVVAH